MTELRSKGINELKLRNRSEKTIVAYTDYIYRLAKYHMLAPEKLSLEQIKQFLRHLIGDLGLSPKTVNVAFNAIIFLVKQRLKCAT